MNAANKEGFTPLIEASVGGHTEAIEALMAKKAEVNAANTDVSVHPPTLTMNAALRAPVIPPIIALIPLPSTQHPIFAPILAMRPKRYPNPNATTLSISVISIRILPIPLSLSVYYLALTLRLNYMLILMRR